GYYGSYGPVLSTAQPDALTRWDDGVHWLDLVRVLGQPAPYWPYQLRIPKLMAAWEPGAPPVTYAAISDVDNTPLLRLATALPQDSPAHKVLLHLASVIQLGSTNGALRDLEVLAERQRRGIVSGRLRSAIMVVAARPMRFPEFSNETLDEQHRRAGWLEVLARTDQLSAECVRIADTWDGGKKLPFSNSEIIDPTTEYGAEWAARLEPMERTAEFAIIDPDRCATLTDPATDAPVVRRSDDLLVTLVPQRLAATTPLAEVILDSPIWVRTKDGTLYPAPKDSYYGLSWGEYGGSGPGSLALLIHRLLDDITAPGADGTDGAPVGLEKLIETDWPRGPVLTRRQLETARNSHPHTEE
ncbi:MAG: hypothetical protein LC799_29835, partial [Actinobacteria bacterium]|nr:hypothetical protein [Actinomycetota bacterium]